MRHTELGISIRKTPVGKGIFARKQFRKSQVIGQMHGRLIQGDDYDPSYVVDMGKFGVLDPKAPFRYLNHSCEPNAALVEYPALDSGEPSTMWVEATRTIREGDQITIDYGWPADAAIPCQCGAAKCRGWVVDANQVRIIEQRERRRRRAASNQVKKKTRKQTAR